MHPEFPQDHGLIYLNHAAVSPWPKRTCAAVQQFAQENMENGARYYPKWLHKEQQLRERLCRILNAESPATIALQKNTSEALSVIAYGLSWKQGDNVVLAEQEFPSNRIVWESLRRIGVETRVVTLPDFENPEAALIAAMDKNTRLLTTSSVHYATGLRVNLERLSASCRKLGVLLCIDAIQSLGAFALDVRALEADFAVADGHKWMLGPEGLAVFYCRPERLNELKLHQYGWHMVEDAGNYDQTDWQPSGDSRRFECGSPNMLGIYALEASLALIEETGIQAVSDSISRNVSYLIENIEYMQNVEPCSPVSATRRAGIFTFRIKNVDHTRLHQYLMSNKVICARRGGGIRFSPHFYNSPEQLDNALEILQSAIKSLS
jgi:selenocysteine lyase/cysteine desulfurase